MAVICCVVSCRLIDDDLTACEADYEMDYEMALVTNVSTEIKAELSMETTLAVSSALKGYVGKVFTDFAHDVDLSFFDVTGDSLRLHHISYIMDASESTYKIVIPQRRYVHIAAANVQVNGLSSLDNVQKCHDAVLRQEQKDTLDSQKTGLYAAMVPMEVVLGEDQHFDVKMHMVNCASSLVLDTLGSKVKDVRVFVSGFASEFDICDSLFRFKNDPVIRTDKVPVDQPGHMCFAAVHFPTREAPETRSVVETIDPFASEEEASGITLWTIIVYVYLQDGSVTRNILSISNPIRPGQFRIIKGKLLLDGSVDPEETCVGVLITPQWDDGGHHIVPL
ncbi:MAG: hypothetical protein J5669_05025 [Bacteroidales bacterium]|nr:hypothetical protein [Bacteroidales bacterium]